MTRSPASYLISLYGPPGVGKSRVGRELAGRLGVPFWDSDEEIQARAGRSILDIFNREGEAGFRRRECAVLEELLEQAEGVIALGGGALLDESNRRRAEAAGGVICMRAPIDVLLNRLGHSKDPRPLLAEDMPARLEALLAIRADHYDSFPDQLDATKELEDKVWEIQVRTGSFRVSWMGAAYDVRVRKAGLDGLGEMLRLRGVRGPIAVVSDEHVGPLYSQRALASLTAAGYNGCGVLIPAGEDHKNMRTVMALWEKFLEHGLERSSAAVALGGGVVGDMTGFAASAYLRGIDWIAVPTSLLAMADASLGGKTGVDLPQGKNLVGAFHPPRLVLADAATLDTLPPGELRAGMAEVVKAGVIGDPQLYDLCSAGWEVLQGNLGEVVRRAMAVKISVIEQDPYEKGQRASLNLGHTIGHAVELVSGFAIRHGEAVAIGMVAEARLAERLGVAQDGLADDIERNLKGLGLPVDIPAGMDRQSLLQAMSLDKKRRDGKVRFALPVRVGEVRVGIEVNLRDEWGEKGKNF